MNKDSYLILETLPTEYDSRVKAMEVDERPTEQYSDIGGLDKQIQEVRLRCIDTSGYPYTILTPKPSDAAGGGHRSTHEPQGEV